MAKSSTASTASFAGVAKHYGVQVAICPPRTGNRKGVVEKINHTAAQRWWRTLADELTVEQAQVDLDRFAAVRGEFNKQGKGPLTKTSALNTKKIIAGLGLSGDQARELGGRLSGLNSAGIGRVNTPTGSFAAGPVMVESTVNLNVDGHQMTKVVTRGQQKRQRRNPAQSRGPNRSGF